MNRGAGAVPIPWRNPCPRVQPSARRSVQFRKNDQSSWNVFGAIPDVKTPFTAYCNMFEHSLRSVVPDHRVIPVQGDTMECNSHQQSKTTKGLIEIGDAISLALQEAVSGTDLSKVEYSLHTEAGWQNLKTLCYSKSACCRVATFSGPVQQHRPT